MVHCDGLPETGAEEKRALEKHVNDVLFMTTRFAAAFLGRMPASESPFDEKELPLFREMVCPPHVKSDKKRKELLFGTMNKLCGSDFATLEASERYVLARVCSAAFACEVNAIDRIMEEDPGDMLSAWMLHYRIKDEDLRKSVTSAMKGLDRGKWDKTADEYLEGKGKKYRDAVMRAVGEPALLQFEFPSCIYMVFNSQEMQLLAGLQPETVGDVDNQKEIAEVKQ